MFMIKSSQALMFAGKEPFPTIYVDSQKEGEVGLLTHSSCIIPTGNDPIRFLERK